MGIRWATAEAIPQISRGDALRGVVFAAVSLAGMISAGTGLDEDSGTGLPGLASRAAPSAHASTDAAAGVEGEAAFHIEDAGTPSLPAPALPPGGSDVVPVQPPDTGPAGDAASNEPLAGEVRSTLTDDALALASATGADLRAQAGIDAGGPDAGAALGIGIGIGDGLSLGP